MPNDVQVHLLFLCPCKENAGFIVCPSTVGCGNFHPLTVQSCDDENNKLSSNGHDTMSIIDDVCPLKNNGSAFLLPGDFIGIHPITPAPELCQFNAKYVDVAQIIVYSAPPLLVRTSGYQCSAL